MPVGEFVIDVKDLEAMLAIIDSGSISRAAERLGVTQPALSLKLKKMESDLGTQLFIRTPRAVKPLETCRTIEPVARDLLLRLASIKDVLAASVADLEGNVRVGCLLGWFDALLIPLFQRLSGTAPKVRLQMQVQETADLLAAVGLGQIDMAIVAMPFERAEGLIYEHLLDERLALVSLHLPAGDGGARFRDELLAMKWVMMTGRDALVSQYWKSTFGEDFPWHQIGDPICVDQLMGVRSLLSHVKGTVGVLPSQIIFPRRGETNPFDTHVSHTQPNGLFLVSRENGLELKRVRLVHDILCSCAHEVKDSLYATVSHSDITSR
jgi:DNA-binding transcriptional LysR family regulator